MALIPPIVTVMEKACKNASKSLIRDFGELEKLQISRKDMNDFVSSADIKSSKSIAYSLNKDKPDFLQIDEETFKISDKEKLNLRYTYIYYRSIGWDFKLYARYSFFCNINWL